MGGRGRDQIGVGTEMGMGQQKPLQHRILPGAACICQRRLTPLGDGLRQMDTAPGKMRCRNRCGCPIPISIPTPSWSLPLPPILFSSKANPGVGVGVGLRFNSGRILPAAAAPCGGAAKPPAYHRTGHGRASSVPAGLLSAAKMPARMAFNVRRPKKTCYMTLLHHMLTPANLSFV